MSADVLCHSHFLPTNVEPSVLHLEDRDCGEAIAATDHNLN